MAKTFIFHGFGGSWLLMVQEIPTKQLFMDIHGYSRNPEKVQANRGLPFHHLSFNFKKLGLKQPESSNKQPKPGITWQSLGVDSIM